MKKIIGIVVVLLILSAFFGGGKSRTKKQEQSVPKQEEVEDYANYMSKYADAMEKLDQIDEDELSAAEYAYYVDTMARIQKKLLEVSQ